MTEHKYLSSCTDYIWIKNNYSDETLAEFEQTIAAYEEDKEPNNGESKLYKDFTQEGYKPIIDWYDGMIDTNELFEMVEPDIIPMF